MFPSRTTPRSSSTALKFLRTGAGLATFLFLILCTDFINAGLTAPLPPGGISFASSDFSVNENGGAASITLTRTGGSDGALTGRVTLADVTTSPADYIISHGAVDPTFTAPPISTVYYNKTMALQPDGKIIVADSISVWRLNPDGSKDPTFNGGSIANAPLMTVAVQPDGKIVIGGNFSTINNQRANRIARLHTDGSLDATFDTGTGANEDVRKLIVQPDGKIIAFGLFNKFNEVSCPGLVRLNHNGSIDFAYSFPVGSYQSDIALQPDGKLLVSGLPGITRRNSDGTPDSSFNFNAGALYAFRGGAMDVQPDGKIIIYGTGTIEGHSIFSLARLNTDGTLDSTFSEGTGTDQAIADIAVQPDGKILIAGPFNSYNGTGVFRLARLNSNGSLDSTLTNNLWNISGHDIADLLLQPDGKILIRGFFRVLGPNIRDNFARLTNDMFVTWKDGETGNKTVTLPLVNDSILEPSETSTLSVTAVTPGATPGANPTATLTITDNDVNLTVAGTGTYNGTATLVAMLASFDAGVGGKTISFSRNGVALGQAITNSNGVATLVNVSLAGLNAGTYPNAISVSFAGDSAYGSKSGTGTLTVDKADQTITFGPLANKTAADSNFNVSANATSGSLVSFAASGQCTMFSFSTVRITGAGTCTITATQGGTLNHNAATPVQQTFNISVAARTPTVTSSSNPSDFGQNVTFTATIPSAGALPTGTIQFKVDGANAGTPVALNANGAASFSTFNLATGTHTITAEYSGDASFSPGSGELAGGQVVRTPPTISINDISITEGSAGTKNATFTASLSAQSNLTIRVDLATADGTAVAGSDYQAVSGTLTFNPFQTVRTFNIVLTADTANEPDETFFVNLTNPQNATILKGQGTGTILNDDSPFIQLASNSYTVSEGVNSTPQGYGTLTVTVNRTGDKSIPATVQYSTSDLSGGNECNQNTGQASQRCDYALAGGTLRFAVGEASKTITIPIVNDGYVESMEFFYIKLENAAGAAVGQTNQAAIAIVDDDTAPTAGTNNPYLSNEFFVRMDYLDFLGREPDSEGWNTWTGVLNNCGPEKGFLGAPKACDRAFVSHGFIASPEFTTRGYLAYRMYEVALSRLPRYSEFVPDMAAMSGAPNSQELEQNTQQFADSFTARAEFTAKYGDVSTPAQAALFIARLEQNAGVTLPATTTTLPGQPPQYGRQELINLRLNGTLTLGQTLRAFVEQKVVYDRFFERGFVTMQYFGFLKRDPDLNDPNLLGWTEWVFVFTNGGAARNRPDILPRDIHHLTFGFIYSEEYRKRFGQP